VTTTRNTSLYLGGDDQQRLIEQARSFPMLTAEQELDYVRRWREKEDPEAAHQLLGSHLRLVIKLARAFRGYGFPLSELISEGNVGLSQALAKYDPAHGVRFATYAMWWIRAAMRDYVLRNQSLVRLGTTAAQKRLFFNLRRVKGELGAIGEGSLPDEMRARIATELGVSEDQVTEMDERLAGADRSLNAPMSEDGSMTWEDALTSTTDQEHDVVEADELAWRRELLASGLEVLNERERHILSERRLVDEPKTLEDLSVVYGVSRERIRQIEARAFEKLQKAMLAEASNRAASQGSPAIAA